MAVDELARSPAPAPGSAPAGHVPRRGRLRGLAATGEGATSWAWAGLVTVLAAALRLIGLDDPKGRMFDEVYYAKDSFDLLRYGVELDKEGTGPGFVVHPPLGKWLIALGQGALGNSEMGWRISAAVAGTLSVLVLCRVARRLTGSTLLGCTAGLLLALDGLHFVQSRIAMLDIFLMLFVLAAFACLVADRDATRSGRAGSGRGRGLHRLTARPWRLAAGALLGAACATKWSGLYFLAAFGLLTLAWDLGARRAAHQARPVRAVLRRDLPGAVAALGVLPLAGYLLSWTGWFVSDRGWARQWADGRDSALSFVPAPLRSLWHYHWEMWNFHQNLSTTHPYDSSPWGWLLLARPVSYFYEAPGGCGQPVCAQEVLAIGTPMLWWAFLPALVGAAWLWAARRDWRAGAALVGAGAGLLPWFAEPGRTMFLFYALPALPFLVLALTLCLGALLGPLTASPLRRMVGAAIVGAYVALVAVVFFHFHPVLTAEVLTVESWRDRIWFRSWI